MVKKMKIPLKYQTTEYDCCPTTYLNALSYLFDREVIPIELVKGIYDYTLDLYKTNEKGSGGTSRIAHLLLSHFIQDYSIHHHFPLETEMYYGSKVDEELFKAVLRKGVIVARVQLKVEHYVLVTGLDREFVYFFDPYYIEEEVYDKNSSIWIVNKSNNKYNRKVKKIRFFASNKEDFSLGAIDKRECASLYIKKKTKK